MPGTPANNPATPPQGGGNAPQYQIQIDRVHYTVHQESMTGAELRRLPTPPIDLDRDLFEVVPSHPDKKIGVDEAVQIRTGKRFFTAPALINPGLIKR